MRISMNPPPPRFPAGGCTTASTNPVATAASTALPPACIISTPAREAKSWTLTTIPWDACTGSVEPSALAEANTATAAISSKINDLCLVPMKVEGVQDKGGLLRLADGSKRSQIRNARVGRTPPSANSIHGQKSQTLLVFFECARLEELFFPLVFFPGAFAATISYDCRIRSSNSFHCTASSRF